LILEYGKKDEITGDYVDPLKSANLIQKWTRRLLVMKHAKHKFLHTSSVIKYITSSHKASLEKVKLIEDKLGPYIVDWDIDKYKDILEFRKPHQFSDGSVYHGYWNKQTNKKEGYGVHVLHNGSKYEGLFEKNLFNGDGRLIYDNGDYYIGQWANGRIDGKGLFVSSDGSTYKGGWKKDSHHGYGVSTWANGSYYEGNHNCGTRDGKGKFINANKVIYEGEFKGNCLNGKGILNKY
jgi:hypothetical protein